RRTVRIGIGEGALGNGVRHRQAKQGKAAGKPGDKPDFLHASPPYVGRWDRTVLQKADERRKPGRSSFLGASSARACNRTDLLSGGNPIFRWEYSCRGKRGAIKRGDAIVRSRRLRKNVCADCLSLSPLSSSSHPGPLAKPPLK